MKTKRLPLILWVFILFVLSSFVALYPTGAPPAKTGSPGDGSNCTECHGGTPSNVTGWITSTIPASGYVPGQTYQVTANNQLTGTGKFGFEVSPQNVAGTLLGTLTAGTNSQLVGSNKYVTHTNASTTVSSWTFSWTAPAAGTGTVTFYGAFARNKPGPVRLSTLVVNEQAALPGNAGPISGPSAVCKGNSYSYSVGTITGATNYVWSVPTGVTITSGQGTTSITANYGNSAVSGTVSVYGSNSAGNGLPSNLSVSVNSVPAQPATITGPAAPCQGTTETYSVTNVAGVTYNWQVPTGSSITSGQGSSSINVTIGPNSGNVQVVPSNGCGNGTARSLALNVSTIPAAASTPTGPDIIDLASVNSCDYMVTAVASASSYQWELVPAEAGTITGSGMMATVNWGSYLGIAGIRVKALNDCGEGAWSAVKQTQVINTTGIAENSNQPVLNIYPNPSNSHFTLKMNGNNDFYKFSILDVAGKERYAGKASGHGETVLDLPLEQGIYLVVISDGDYTLKQKLFIQ